MALTTLAALKTLIGEIGSSRDTWLEALRTAAEAIIAEYCGRTFEQATYTEYYSGTGTKYLTLRQRPVTSITNVWVDHTGYFSRGPTPFASTTVLTEGTDYVLDYDYKISGTDVSRSGLLLRLNDVWRELPRVYYSGRLTGDASPSFGSIKVTYVGGYATIPEDLKAAVAFLVAGMLRSYPLGGSPEAERIGDYSYTIGRQIAFGTNPLPELASARQILARYRELSW